MTEPMVIIESFGYLHGPAPAGEVILDVRDSLRNPHTDLNMRELTGEDLAVRDHVMNTPGARLVLHSLFRLAFNLADIQQGKTIRVRIGCAGGRHRSVVLANALGNRLALAQIATDVTHRDMHLPVVVH